MKYEVALNADVDPEDIEVIVVSIRPFKKVIPQTQLDSLVQRIRKITEQPVTNPSVFVMKTKHWIKMNQPNIGVVPVWKKDKRHYSVTFVLRGGARNRTVLRVNVELPFAMK